MTKRYAAPIRFPALPKGCLGVGGAWALRDAFNLKRVILGAKPHKPYTNVQARLREIERHDRDLAAFDRRRGK